MDIERRELRSAKPWLAVGHLFAKRAPQGALLADDQGLPLVAHGVAEHEVERHAAELLRSDAPVVRTGSGLGVRLYAPTLTGDATRALSADLARILSRV